MDRKTFTLDILTLESPIFRGEVFSLTAPGAMGEFGILADHAPFVSELKKGKLKIHPSEGDKETFLLKGGFLSVEKNRVVVLAEIE